MSVIFNKSITESSEFASEFKKNFSNGTSCEISLEKDGSVRVAENSDEGSKRLSKIISMNDGFPAALISNILDDKFAKDVKKDVLAQKFYEKSNDLYSFLQSQDLKVTKSDNLKRLREELASSKFVSWISELTGIPLITGKLDLASQRYRDTDHLLCHDDDIDENEDGTCRRIAFILYLVPEDWNEKDGGQLELFKHDSNTNLPLNSEKDEEKRFKLVPEWNSFAFFRVSPVSYHQVSEITSNKKERVSITGWFYGFQEEKEFDFGRKIEALSNDVGSISHYNLKIQDTQQNHLKRWMNPQYLQPNVIQQIRDHFAEMSFIDLRKVLKVDLYNKMFKELRSVFENPSFCDTVGPPNSKLHEAVDIAHLLADESNEYPSIKSLLQFLISEQFSYWLSQITQLDLNSSVDVEFRNFKSSCYTLLNDKHINYSKKSSLELCFNLTSPVCREWKEHYGGDLVYLDEEDSLLNAYPNPNSMLLVLRDEGVLRFVRYLNHKAKFERTDLFLQFDILESDDSA